MTWSGATRWTRNRYVVAAALIAAAAALRLWPLQAQAGGEQSKLPNPIP